MNVVQFHYADIKSVRLHHKRKVQQYISTIFSNEGKLLSRVDYIFCSDEYILNINRTFLNHDYYTDIITFDLTEADGIVGELYIGVETVTSNSILHHTPFEEEMLRVLFHGVLHLCGYGDKTKSEITKMRQKEDYYLMQYYSIK